MKPPPAPDLPDGAHYKIGKPYQIKGSWYYPREDYSYDETGIASWYGDDFHNLKTANGEIFNKDELTAAHHTLPLPSLARVTNLENGRSIVVRINDRGPFSGSRIIDLSQRAAQLLEFERQGTAKVRVQVLSDESKAIADAMRRYGSSSPSGETLQASADTSVTSEPLPAPQGYAEQPLPTTRAEAHEMLGRVNPVQEVRQLPVTGSNQIYVQAGAFTKQENAMRLQQKLLSVGKASVVEANVKGTQYFRVRVGPIPDVAKADALLKKVRTSGVEGARIVVD